MKTELLILSALSVLLTACATAQQPVSPGRQSELRARAHECKRVHPEIERYEVDRFGRVTAYFRMAGSVTASTDPFFECVFARK